MASTGRARQAIASRARVLFGTAAAFNVAVGAGLVFVRPWLGPALGLDPIAGTNLVLVNLCGALIVLFGAVYACIAGDPVRYRPLIALGVVGKLLAVVSAVLPWASGAISSTLPILTGADVVFAMLFVDFLRRPSEESS